jgi:hypothetical protein
MDRDLARIVLIACRMSTRELARLPPIIKEHNPDEKETKTINKAIAGAIADIYMNIIDQVEAEHPDLKAETEDRYAKYGVLF